MENKTCGECFYWDFHNGGYCGFHAWYCKADVPFCPNFIWKTSKTIFHKITASPEVLAGSFIGNIYNDKKSEVMYYSMLTQCWYNNKLDAFNATVAKLKEVAR